MKAITYLSIVIGVAICIPVVWVFASHSLSAESRKAAQAQMRPTWHEDGPPPSAVIDSSEHDFGTMDPYTEATHTFLIRNDGPGTLKIWPGPRTCKCTSAKLPTRSIAPGDSAKVVLTWHTIDEATGFRHGATVFTNDPSNEQINFRVHGDVLRVIASNPPEVTFSQLGRESESRRAVIFSQKWSGFAIEEVTSSLDGLTWDISAADKGDLGPQHGKSGYRMVVTMPADLPPGSFQHSLKLMIRSEDDPAVVETLEVPVVGRVLRRLAVYGPEINSAGVVNLGTLDHGEGSHAQLMMKVRDDEKSLTIKDIDVQPSFVEVEVAPQPGVDPELGIYQLSINIPRDAPSGFYRDRQAGAINLQIDHPRIPELKLRLDFAVVEN